MSRTYVTRAINAPIEQVFDTIAHIENFSKAVPDIIRVEHLGEVQRGVGTHFKETRVMRGKEQVVELKVTEYVVNERVRLVSEAGGSVWDTVFTVMTEDGRTQMTMVMDAHPKNLFARLMNRMIAGMVKKAVESDMDAVVAYCERQAQAE